MSALSKLIAARTSLILDSPFFGSLILNLKMKEDKGCKTGWVNGRELGYNPDFINSLPHERVLGFCAHEVMHPAMGHPWRREGRDHKLFNMACDYAINGELIEAGFILPDDVLVPPQEWKGKSAEWIYERLQAQQSENEPQPGPGNPQPGNGQGTPDPDGQPDDSEQEPGEDEEPEKDDSQEPDDSEPSNDSQDGQEDGTEPQEEPLDDTDVRDAPTTADEDGDPAPSEQDWKQKVTQAAQMAAQAGKLPGGMKRLVQQALKPKLDPKSLLHRFLSERSSGDFSWTRPNSRYISMGLYLPTLESKSLGEIAVLCDTSASTSDISLNYARGILQSILDEVNPAGVTLYMVDTEIHGVQRMERGDPLTWEPQGGGGTSFASFFRHMETTEPQPVCVIGISDLQADFGDTVPSLPILWLTDTKDGTAPFGEVVELDR